MKHFLPLLLPVVFALQTNAQIVNIPDANFKSALLNYPRQIDTNGDGEIQVTEASAFTGQLFLSDKNIANYTGLEAFTSINELVSRGNPATTITLTNKPNLSRVFLSNGQLSNLTAQGLPLLKDLMVDNNRLTGITLGNLPNLETINVSYNLLTTLTVENFPKLLSLGCGRNPLTTLITSNLPLLKALYCEYGRLVNPTFNLPSLEKLFMEGNPLTSFTLGYNITLTELNCGESDLTSLPPLNSPALNYLYCNYSKLTSFSLSGYNHLKRLELHHNKISSLNLRNLPVLTDLTIHQNSLNTLALDSLPSLGIIITGGDSLRAVSLRLPQLSSFNCDSSRLTQLDLSNTRVINTILNENPDLQYINFKNGHVLQVGTVPGVYTITRAPSLVQVCGDDGELANISSSLNASLPGQLVSVSSLCNFTPSNFNTIKGELRFDRLNNGCSPADSTISNFKIRVSSPSETGYAFTNNAGRYAINVTGSPDTVSVITPNAYFSATPASRILSFTGTGAFANADFCITSNGIHPDAEISLIPLSQARPGFLAAFKLLYRNKGNQTLSGTVTLTYDPAKQTYNSSSPSGTAAGGTITWNYTDLTPFETRSILVQMNMAPPPVNNGGDQLLYHATINPVAGDETPDDNHASLKQVLVNSMDPNDKTVLEGSKIDISEVNNFLHYVVRFQNTGTADAIHVVIKDSLSANLDWSTFTPLTASHQVYIQQLKGDHLVFTFSNINLPVAAVNEPASHGYVAFKIKPKNGLTVGDAISNKAAIYFDFNAPIITNTTITTVVKPESFTGPGIRVFNSPAKDNFKFILPAGALIESANLFNLSGQRMPVNVTAAGSNTATVDISGLPSGIYVLQVITGDKKFTEKILVVK